MYELGDSLEPNHRQVCGMALTVLGQLPSRSRSKEDHHSGQDWTTGIGFACEPGVSGGLEVTDIKSGMGGVNQAQRPGANGLGLQASGSILISCCCLHLVQPDANRQRPKITQVWPQKSRDWSTFKSVTTQPLKQQLTHLVCKGPAATYFRLCSHRGPAPTSCVGESAAL